MFIIITILSYPTKRSFGQMCTYPVVHIYAKLRAAHMQVHVCAY